MTRTHRVCFPHTVLPLALVLPQVVLLALFVYWPAAETVRAALGTGDEPALGLEAFATLVASADYGAAAWFTAWFSATVAVAALGISLILAIKADTVLRAAGYRLAFVWAFAVAPPAAGVIALMMADIHPGAIIEAFRLAGVKIDLGGDSIGTIGALVAVSVWKLVPIDFACLLAALHLIPGSVHDAALIDFSSRWRRFTAVTWPLIAPACALLGVVNLAFALFETYGVFDIMARGGTANLPASLVHRAVSDGLAISTTTDAAAQSVVLMMIALVLFGALVLIGARYARRGAR